MDQIEKKKSYGIEIKKIHELPSWQFILDFGKKIKIKKSWTFLEALNPVPWRFSYYKLIN